MNNTTFKELEISQLTLGTVQFGLNYGLANTSGQPSLELARNIIKAACEGGVNCLDTAAAYGESEEVIGQVMEDLNLKERINVVSKVKYISSSKTPVDNVMEHVEKSVLTSLKRLRLDFLPICLMHTELDLEYFDFLLAMKDKGLVKHAGVSVDTPEAAKKALEMPIEAIQLPFNVIDKRLDKINFFEQAVERNIAVFVRSVYLQGLLLMPEEDIPEVLLEVLPTRRKLAKLADENGMSMVELSLRFGFTQNGVASVLTGVDNVEQIRSNLAIFDQGPIDDDIMSRIAEIVPEFPELILRPMHWPNRMVVPDDK